MRLLFYILMSAATFMSGVMYQKAFNNTPYTKEACDTDVMIVRDELRHEKRSKDGCELIAIQCLDDVSNAEYRLKLCQAQLQREGGK
jgi:hypothetical protein